MENYESNHKLKDNLELIEIAFFGKKDYKKEAILSAKKIIKERNLSIEKVKELKHIVRTRRKEERQERRREMKEGKGCSGWIMDIIFIFLPGI